MADGQNNLIAHFGFLDNREEPLYYPSRHTAKITYRFPYLVPSLSLAHG